MIKGVLGTTVYPCFCDKRVDGGGGLIRQQYVIRFAVKGWCRQNQGLDFGIKGKT